MDGDLLLVLGLAAIAIVVVLAFIVLAADLFTSAVAGAVHLYRFAREKAGIVGIAFYLACWVFILPVMLIVSLFVGGRLLRRMT